MIVNQYLLWIRNQDLVGSVSNPHTFWEDPDLGLKLSKISSEVTPKIWFQVIFKIKGYNYFDLHLKEKGKIGKARVFTYT